MRRASLTVILNRRAPLAVARTRRRAKRHRRPRRPPVDQQPGVRRRAATGSTAARRPATRGTQVNCPDPTTPADDHDRGPGASTRPRPRPARSTTPSCALDTLRRAALRARERASPQSAVAVSGGNALPDAPTNLARLHRRPGVLLRAGRSAAPSGHVVVGWDPSTDPDGTSPSTASTATARPTRTAADDFFPAPRPVLAWFEYAPGTGSHTYRVTRGRRPASASRRLSAPVSGAMSGRWRASRGRHDARRGPARPVLMLIVLGATLTTFNTFERKTQRQPEPERGPGQARRGLDLMARDLRNLASPTPQPAARRGPLTGTPGHDLPVRGQGEAGGQPERAEHDARALLPRHRRANSLYRQIQTWTTRGRRPGVPASQRAGPTAGWNSTMAVATDVATAPGRCSPTTRPTATRSPRSARSSSSTRPRPAPRRGGRCSPPSSSATRTARRRPGSARPRCPEGRSS